MIRLLLKGWILKKIFEFIARRMGQTRSSN